MSDVPTRIFDRLQQEAPDENDERDWCRTGLIPCHDCDTTARTRTLETLPRHNCTQRQRDARTDLTG